MMTQSQHINLSMPDWVQSELERLPSAIPDINERMRTVIRFSRINVEQNTGGPFAAGVFEKKSGKIISIGVNRVIDNLCTSAHAEVMALSLAQQKLDRWDLGGQDQPVYQLVVNWRPCIMCYGATIWSGIRSLAIAGAGPELESITGFDEGPLPKQWREELESRGIEVIDNVLTSEAIVVYEMYRDAGRLVYNSRQGDRS